MNWDTTGHLNHFNSSQLHAFDNLRHFWPRHWRKPPLESQFPPGWQLVTIEKQRRLTEGESSLNMGIQVTIAMNSRLFWYQIPIYNITARPCLVCPEDQNGVLVFPRRPNLNPNTLKPATLNVEHFESETSERCIYAMQSFLSCSTARHPQCCSPDKP